MNWFLFTALLFIVILIVFAYDTWLHADPLHIDAVSDNQMPSKENEAQYYNTKNPRKQRMQKFTKNLFATKQKTKSYNQHIISSSPPDVLIPTTVAAPAFSSTTTPPSQVMMSDSEDIFSLLG